MDKTEYQHTSETTYDIALPFLQSTEGVGKKRRDTGYST